MKIVLYSVSVFITQLIFIGFRTWNVKAVSASDIRETLISGGVTHIAWLAGIALGGVSMYEIIGNFRFEYIPVVLSSLAGGLLGSWITLAGLKTRDKKTKKGRRNEKNSQYQPTGGADAAYSGKSTLVL